jgi:hypothetical protein
MTISPCFQPDDLPGLSGFEFEDDCNGGKLAGAHSEAHWTRRFFDNLIDPPPPGSLKPV